MSAIIKYKPRVKTSGIILHDSHTVPDICTIEDVPRWAVLAHEGGLKMGILSIGYHYIIERDGTEVACRDEDLIGSHTPGHNMDSLGICLVGGREADVAGGVDNFTREQKHTLFLRVQKSILKWGPLWLKGHSEVQRYRHRDTPSCPALDMNLLREDLDLFLDHGLSL